MVEQGIAPIKFSRTDTGFMTQADKITIVIDGEDICSFDEALLPQVREIINANSAIEQMIEEMGGIELFFVDTGENEWQAKAVYAFSEYAYGDTIRGAVRALYEKWQAQK